MSINFKDSNVYQGGEPCQTDTKQVIPTWFGFFVSFLFLNKKEKKKSRGADAYIYIYKHVIA